jgi:hypothetical protein
VPSPRDPIRVVDKSARRWLSDHSDWLLILDNADTREAGEA